MQLFRKEVETNSFLKNEDILLKQENIKRWYFMNWNYFTSIYKVDNDLQDIQVKKPGFHTK